MSDNSFGSRMFAHQNLACPDLDQKISAHNIGFGDPWKFDAYIFAFVKIENFQLGIWISEHADDNFDSDINLCAKNQDKWNF